MALLSSKDIYRIASYIFLSKSQDEDVATVPRPTMRSLEGGRPLKDRDVTVRQTDPSEEDPTTIPAPTVPKELQPLVKDNFNVHGWARKLPKTKVYVTFKDARVASDILKNNKIDHKDASKQTISHAELVMKSLAGGKNDGYFLISKYGESGEVNLVGKITNGECTVTDSNYKFSTSDYKKSLGLHLEELFSELDKYTLEFGDFSMFSEHGDTLLGSSSIRDILGNRDSTREKFLYDLDKFKSLVASKSLVMPS